MVEIHGPGHPYEGSRLRARRCHSLENVDIRLNVFLQLQMTYNTTHVPTKTARRDQSNWFVAFDELDGDPGTIREPGLKRGSAKPPPYRPATTIADTPVNTWEWFFHHRDRFRDQLFRANPR